MTAPFWNRFVFMAKRARLLPLTHTPGGSRRVKPAQAQGTPLRPRPAPHRTAPGKATAAEAGTPCTYSILSPAARSLAAAVTMNPCRRLPHTAPGHHGNRRLPRSGHSPAPGTAPPRTATRRRQPPRPGAPSAASSAPPTLPQREATPAEPRAQTPPRGSRRENGGGKRGGNSHLSRAGR